MINRVTVRWIAAAVLLTLLVAWLLFVPIADWLAYHDVGAAKGPMLAAARDAARGRLLTLGAGLLAAGALLFTARNFGLSREGQVTDRYTKAIEQIGSEKLDVRIGGIYALERIALDSARDHPTVMEVLTAFIREHSREAWEPPDYNGPAENRPPRPDIQAATTVIARRDHTRDRRLLNLEGANLNYVNLSRVNFVKANLIDATLYQAKLWRADFSGADLSRTNLRSATFAIASLRAACLSSANLNGASFNMVDFTRADLSNAELSRTEFTNTSFDRAILARADFTHADLARADLSGANLTRTNLSDAELPPNLDNVDLARADLTGAKIRPEAIPEGWELNAASRLIRKHRGSAGLADD